ncbi:MAG TPA: DUF3795 domain-containing protein [Candidatus Sumerlaeota bacterium]|nr:DUF3795 domain-containing protein [Candidatus Sumerlaeota bacterium]HON51314.1 DUF3795 domain-containing protein [Candidatus Sumerlaeota bacterium]HOR65692.1 DUF3795 domain-containing protein [Candidatus Sumerlaeota bacterium]HPL73737.1 DUF3795 domain-containing protein [Candidatus Sumerlaeota bacterium]HRU54803.1 DUF3795 domain-containing protein [Candidatus Sumerlaeia bacterium]
MIAYCGLDCGKCETFIATVNDDDNLREAIAKKWSEQYSAPFAAKDINCVGCKSAGAKIYYCEQLCEIRKCASAKNIAHCGICDKYPCSILKEFFKMAPDAQRVLDALKS